MKRIIIILAAGAASRFGGPKALTRWQDGTLLTQALDTVGQIGDADALVVTGRYAAEMAPALDGVAAVHNPAWPDGIGTSIVAGLQTADARGADIVAVLPVDQPLVTPGHLRGLLDKAQSTGRICFSRDGGVHGPPVAIPRTRFPLALALRADQGLKSIVDEDQCRFLDQTGVLADIDTPADLERLEAYALNGKKRQDRH